ncbi:MAG TPA: HAD family hydrolase, partial [Candidatus Hydrogenedentes bacterium]|nr:HAD family hydrolase [Candidatus Hydrogenedentota bacterium]
MQCQAILFDLDGTLLDTLADLGRSVNRVLAAHGFPVHPLDAYRYFVGRGARALVRRALPEGARDHATVDVCLAAFHDDYARNWAVDTRPYDGVPAMLDAVAARDVP